MLMKEQHGLATRSPERSAAPGAKSRIRILSVDDHPFVFEGLRARLSLEPEFECVGHMGSAANLLQEVKRLEPDVILLDISMPGPDPFEALADLHRRFPEIRTIVLSAYVRDHYVEAATKAGAWGYVSKADPPEFIADAIRRVMAGEFVMGSEVKERCKVVREGDARQQETAPSRLSLLTPREQQILRLIGKGLSRAAIAKTIFRSPKTVDAHRNSIMEKLGFNDRVDLVRYAIREGLVEP